ncbi:uncharacterized protein LOC122231387 isoform X2 [Panthera tigris]|uniref:uncharacterized protein LOC122231387 isoform X2 n=1 Tax=Panthera tigris TaxID=9694 RepID=UPI001C6F7308|nr:uncharacterized protein LOC122231387 isoform X2 [Panthera tigris]
MTLGAIHFLESVAKERGIIAVTSLHQRNVGTLSSQSQGFSACYLNAEFDSSGKERSEEPPWMCCPSFLPSRTQRTLPHKDQWPDCALSQAQTLSRCPSTSTVSGITLWVHHSRLKKANSEEPSTWRSDPDPVNPLKLTLKKTLAPEISSPAPATPRKLAGLRMEEV